MPSLDLACPGEAGDAEGLTGAGFGAAGAAMPAPVVAPAASAAGADACGGSFARVVDWPGRVSC